ncbi:MAG: hypothetical protein H7235_04695, partial [Bdellovibrionaceae bacterium]|nr:hypothetical protein [Pseudobdellovibrionaceae bacterium]
MLSLIFNFVLALSIPLWVLLIGPVLLGIPHLISSTRYIPKLTNINLLSVPLVGSFFVLVALIRLWIGVHDVNIIELGAGFFLLCLVGFLCKESKLRMISSLSLLSGLFASSLVYPLETLGFLVLAHNFVAFFFWIVRTNSKSDRTTAVVSLLLFILLTLTILTGFFDAFISSRLFEIFNGFNDASIGAQIFPKADMTLWSRAVSAYALGQGIHYFVWLKAIPEQELSYQHTTSFSYSFKLLKSDMGNRIVYFSGLILIGLVTFALFRNFIEARFI